VEKNGVLLDNRHVVPYCPELLLELECHINMECCISVTSVKYIHKYIYKGPDRATLQLGLREAVDEIKQFIDARWIGASEAAWRLFRNRTWDLTPTVYRLQVSEITLLVHLMKSLIFFTYRCTCLDSI
jgi:hypothetical protein